MAKTLSNKDLNAFLKSMEDQGCRIQPIKASAGAWKILPPNNGKPIIFHGSNSDHRGLKNMKSEIKRLGLVWPLSI